MKMNKAILIGALIVTTPCFADSNRPACAQVVQKLTPNQIQETLIRLLTNHVLQYEKKSGKMSVNPSALDQLRQNGRVEDICVLEQGICWIRE